MLVFPMSTLHAMLVGKVLYEYGASHIYIYIYIYIYFGRNKINKLQVHPYKPVS